MITHIALFQFRNDCLPAEIEIAMDQVRMLKEKIPAIIDLRCGKNFSEYSEGYTHAIVVTLLNEAGLNEYRDHPAHKPIAEKLESMEERSIGIDFES